MKKLFTTFMALGLTWSAHAVKFGCVYHDSYKVQSRGKVQTKYDRSPTVSVYGTLDENTGGRFSAKSYFLFGDVGNSKAYQKFNFHRQYRKNESGLKFAKFANKTPAQQKAGEWIPTYVRFSLPKDSFNKSKGNKFTAYFGYFRSKVDPNLMQQSQVQQFDLSSREIEEFKRENNEEFEYKMNCTIL